MKSFALIILTTLILSACQVSSLPSTPITTSTLPQTETKPVPTFTEAPTVVPETVEQRMYRIATEAVAHGAVSPDPKTWPSGEAAEYQKTAFDPTHATQEQLIALHDFDTAMRRADFENYIKENYLDIVNKDMLGKFGREYMRTAQWVSTASSMSPEQALDVIATLTPEQRHDLELVRRNENQENVRRSPWEIISSAKVPNDTFVYTATYDKDAKTTYAYGLWGSDDVNGEYIKLAMQSIYELTVLGQPVRMKGIPLRGTAVVDFVGVEKIYVTADNATEPKEITAIVGRLKNATGGTKILDVEVVTASEEPMTLEATEFQKTYETYLKDFQFSQKAFIISGSTIYAEKSPDNFMALTNDALTSHQLWPPQTVTIYKVHKGAFDTVHKSFSNCSRIRRLLEERQNRRAHQLH